MNKDLATMIMSASDLPTMPVVATKVMQLLESDNVTAEALAKVITADPAVAARVIKISNSAFYGCQRQIQSLSSAIVILGFNTLKSIVVAASLKEVYHPYGLTEKMLWEHSFGAGLAARTIANATRLANEEEAFLAGLFHDIGKIIMNNLDQEKFQRVMQRCYNEGMPFEEIEESVYSFTHAEVGGLVIKKWNFPEILMTVIMQHHRLEFPDPTDLHIVRLTAIINLADNLCKKLGIGEREAQEDLDLETIRSARLLDLDKEKLDALLAKFAEQFENSKTFFAAAG